MRRGFHGLALGILIPLLLFRSLPIGPFVALSFAMSLTVGVVAVLLAYRRFGGYLIAWDDETLSLYQNDREVGTQRWSDLTGVERSSLLNLRLQFQSGPDWIIPSEWTLIETTEQRAFRDQLLRRNRRLALLVPTRGQSRFSIMEATATRRTLIGSWVVVALAWALFVFLGAEGNGLSVLAVLCTMYALVFSALAMRHRLLNGSQWGRVVVTEAGLRGAGREIRWAEIEAVDWSGSQRDQLTVRAAGRKWRLNLGEFQEGNELQKAIRKEPLIRSVWRQQLALIEPVSLSIWRDYLFGIGALSAFCLGPSALIVLLVIDNPTFAWSLLIVPPLIWIWFKVATSPQPYRITQDGIMCMPFRRLVRFNEITDVHFQPSTGTMIVEAGRIVCSFESNMPEIGRVEAILRARVSADAFEDGDDVPARGDGDESNP